MARDFTPDVFRQLLESALHSGYSFSTFSEYLSVNDPTGKCILLRHDIDASPRKALDFAKVENLMGIHSTYYFKTKRKLFDRQVIAEIASLGHEIGYHYEDLAMAKGDPAKAIASFEENLARIRECVPVTTICMDGSIRSRWDNLDLWKTYNYKAYGILGEPYLDLDFDKVLYLTDTGRRWNAIQFSLYDKVNTRFSYTNKSTRQVISDLEKGALPNQVMITLHPQRWHSDYIPWQKEILLQWVKNRVKFLIIKKHAR
jgi:hypothetical protein